MASSLSPIDIERIKASQYVSAVGLVVLLWDHILTFPDEVELIWRSKLSLPKLLFLFNRYVVPFGMIVQSHEFSSTASYISLTILQSCKIWSAVAVAVGMLSVATSNFLVLLRLWVLWDRSPRLMLGTLTFFVVVQILALSFTGYVIYEMLPTIIFDPVLRVCIPTTKPKFALLWSPGVAFECMIFLTTVWNALDRPRCRDSEMAKILYRDGSMYFFGLFVLRVANMVISLVAPVSLIFLGVFFIWSVSNITLAHLILNLRRLSRDRAHRDRAQRLEEDAEVGVECMELPMLRARVGCSEESDSERLQQKAMF